MYFECASFEAETSLLSISIVYMNGWFQTLFIKQCICAFSSNKLILGLYEGLCTLYRDTIAW